MTAARSATTRPNVRRPALAPTITPDEVAPAPDPARAVCTIRMAPRREPSFDDELPPRHLSLIRTSAAPELPFPAPAVARVQPARRLSIVPDPPPTAALPTQALPTGALPTGALPTGALPTGALPTAEPLTRGLPTPVPSSAIAPARVYRSARSTTGPDAATPSSTDEHRTGPDPSRFGRQFAQGVVEVLSGRRPMVQLTRHVSPAVQRGLARVGAGHQLRSDVAPVIHSVHLSEPAEGVCEMSAIVVVGPRYRALAARLEWRSDSWRCTALQVG